MRIIVKVRGGAVEVMTDRVADVLVLDYDIENYAADQLRVVDGAQCAAGLYQQVAPTKTSILWNEAVGGGAGNG